MRWSSAPQPITSSSGCATTTSVRPRSSAIALTLPLMHLLPRLIAAWPHVYSRAMHSLRAEIERLFALGAEAKNDARARSVFDEFLSALSAGKIRAAEKSTNGWSTNVWVKQGILLGFRLGELKESGNNSGLSFVDK